MQGLRLDAPDGSTVLSVSGATADDVSLLGVIFGGKDFGRVVVTDLDLAITQDADGQTNLAKAIASPDADADEADDEDDPSTQDEPPTWAAINAQLELTGRVSYASPTVETTTVDGIVLAVQLTRGRLATSLDGVVKQAANEGRIAADIEVEDLVTLAADPVAALDSVTGTVTLENFPTAWVDQLAGTNGKLLALLGRHVSLVAESTPTDAIDANRNQQVPLSINLTAEAMSLQGRVTASANGIELAEPIVANWTTDPDRWHRVVEAFALPAKRQLDAPATVKLEVLRLNVAMSQPTGSTSAGKLTTDAASIGRTLMSPSR